MCIYCHGTSDWDGNVSPVTGIAPLLTDTGVIKRSVYEIKTMVGNASTVDASKAFPPPLGPPEHTEGSAVPCTGCHQHNNINASCGGCHDFPPTTGAHAAHASMANGKPEFNCQTCHGPSPGSASKSCCASSSTPSGSVAGPAAKLKTRFSMVNPRATNRRRIRLLQGQGDARWIVARRQRIDQSEPQRRRNGK